MTKYDYVLKVKGDYYLGERRQKFVAAVRRLKNIGIDYQTNGSHFSFKIEEDRNLALLICNKELEVSK